MDIISFIFILLAILFVDLLHSQFDTVKILQFYESINIIH